MKFHAHHALLLAAFFAISCSKEDGPTDDNGTKTGLTGKLLYSFTGTVSQLDLTTNEESVYFTYNTYGSNGWDMGRDGQYRLVSEREPGEYYLTHLTLVRNSDGTIVDELDYDSPNDNGTGYIGRLSPDNARIIFAPDFHNGIVITDLDGQVLTHLQGFNNGTEDIVFGLGDEAIWLSDNSILFTADDRYILKSSPPYTTLDLVREMPYTEWGNLRVNASGTKIALMASKHIHVMDVDGQNMTQVTNSKGLELSAVFSPDDKYLAVAKRAGSEVGYHSLVVVPNDGSVYDIDADPNVIWMQPEGEHIPVAVSGSYFWIP